MSSWHCARTQSDRSMHPEILVIGGGAAALAASIEARRAGCSVMLAERAPWHLRGGNARHARNLRLAHLAPNPFSPGVYPPAEFWSDLKRATQGTADPILGQMLVERSLELTEWLLAAGVPLQPVRDHLLPESRRTVFLLGGGKTLLNRLYALAERLGVLIRLETEIIGPKIAGGRLEELIGRCRTELQRLRPRAVIVCCGGFQANRVWLRRHWGQAADGLINRGSPLITGELLADLLAQGAQAIGDPREAYLVAVDARSPPDDGGIVTRIRGIPEGIAVDREGQRREDEGGNTASTRYALWGRRLADWPGQIGYLILDARGFRAAPPALYPPMSAPTPRQLALRLGIDPQAFSRTLDAYNAAVQPTETGDDWQTQGLIPPKTHRAYPLLEPPFHAYPMRPGMTFTYQGLAVGPDTRVRLAGGGALENLFAAGMTMAPNLMPQGYLSGLALTISLVFGRIAGIEAARYVRG